MEHLEEVFAGGWCCIAFRGARGKSDMAPASRLFHQSLTRFQVINLLSSVGPFDASIRQCAQARANWRHRATCTEPHLRLLSGTLQTQEHVFPLTYMPGHTKLMKRLPLSIFLFQNDTQVSQHLPVSALLRPEQNLSSSFQPSQTAPYVG